MSKVKVRHGSSEIELEGADDFIESRLKDFYERLEQLERSTEVTREPLKQQLLEPDKAPAQGKKITPAEFYRSKGKTDGLSQVLIFGKYLEEVEGVSEFSQGDVNRVASDAKLSKNIHAQYFTNAVKQGLLRKHGSSKYSLTLSAEDVLAAM